MTEGLQLSAVDLISAKDRKVTRDRLRVVQFHPSLSYEDFVRGWRPSRNGQLELVDGVFLETVQAAAAEPDRPCVLIIDEINRGNPVPMKSHSGCPLRDHPPFPHPSISILAPNAAPNISRVFTIAPP